MTDTELLLFHYLRAGLWGCTPPAACPSPCDDGQWRQLFALACRQAGPANCFTGMLPLLEIIFEASFIRYMST